ncbi:MAG TPA: hypothetical protein VFO12_00080 [Sphingomicrobium sp.]|nr:hypothetical protein [Sphingomicrobium sp.]
MQIDRRPVVHIGHSKAGTSWFKQSFHPTVTSHRYIDPKIVREALLGPNGLAFDAKRARDLILAAADGLPPLICDERLSGSHLTGGLHGMAAPEMARRIKAILPDARIVIIIRAQPGMLAAVYSQYVKDGGTFGMNRFLFPDSYFFAGSEYRTQAPRFDLAHFEYQRLIRLYFELFGKENVHVVLFEQFRAGPLDCAKGLAQKLGLAFDEQNVSEEVRNPALNRNALRVMRFCNLFTARKARAKWYIVHIPGLFEGRRKLHRLLNRLFRRKSTSEELLGPATARWIEARFAPSNRDLGELLGVDLGASGYPVETPEAPPPSPLPRGRPLRAT